MAALPSAVAEMAMAGRIGAEIAAADSAPLAAFFGEDQGRYLLTARPDEVDRLLQQAETAGIALTRIGTTGGSDLKLGGLCTISVANLTRAHENWFPDFMAGGR